MAGQQIKLAGVTAASTLGVPRILMSAADAIALQVTALAHAVSPSTLVASSTGLNGRCRASGKLLVPKGTVADLQLRTVAGKVGIGLATATTAGLALPAGSATPSYTILAAVQISAADIGSNSVCNLLYTSTAADTTASTNLRYYGTTSANPDKLYGYGSSSSTSTAVILTRPAGDWIIMAIDYNDNTKMSSMSVNGEAFGTFLQTLNHAPGVNGYVCIGYPKSTSSLRSSLVGDIYVFNDSLLKTPLGQSQLTAMIAAMKTDYGIV